MRHLVSCLLFYNDCVKECRNSFFKKNFEEEVF